MNWATVESDDIMDSFSDLADKIRLDYDQRTKWLKKAKTGAFVSEEDEASTCEFYEIPNTVVVYASAPFGWEKWFYSATANIMRRRASVAGDLYKIEGYHVEPHDPGVTAWEFISAWRTDGIYAFAFGGHSIFDITTSAWEGYQANSAVKSGTPPWLARPPYKLQAVYGYACATADTYVRSGTAWRWSDNVSVPYGTFVGYRGDAWALTPASVVNPGSFVGNFVNVP